MPEHSLDMGRIYTEIWEPYTDIYVKHIPDIMDINNWKAISAMDSRQTFCIVALLVLVEVCQY
jgi:hypothetical protein